MQRTFKDIMLVALLAIGATTGAFAQNSARAGEVLARAKEALGGEARLQAVQSLSLAGKLRRAAPVENDQDMAGQFEFEFRLPGQFRRAETLRLPGVTGGLTTTGVLNGDQYWEHTEASGAGRAMRYGADNPQLGAEQRRELRGLFTRYVLALLLAAPPSLAIEWSYAGEAGGGRLEALDARGADGFAARLFFDKQTHLPLLLTYQAKVTLAAMPTGSADNPNAPTFNIAVPAPAPALDGQKQAGFAVATTPARPTGNDQANLPVIEIRLQLAEYRAVDGILLPHRISQSAEGDPGEEWEIAEYRINPPLQPEKFEQKRKE